MLRKVLTVRKHILHLLVVISVTSCGPTRYEPIRNVYRPAAPITQGSHKVRPGETLYAIAWRYNWDHEQLARANGISAPYRIYPGQILSLENKVPGGVRQSTPSSAGSKGKSSSRYKKPVTHTKPVQEKVANQRHKKVDMSWSWPTKGPVIETFSLGKRVNKGIDLAGKRGEPVFSAADGKVVYSGTGLIGYGNLIIIKHSEVYLSAYAHNSRLLVKEGQTTKAGQKIAEIGSSGANRDKLHFEIRRNGKPVNPLQYLPSR